MKITKLEVHILRAPDEDQRPFWVSNFIVPKANEILVRLHTDEGIEGIGIATSYTPIDFAVKAWKSGLAEQIIGEDPLAPERLYNKLFSLTTSKAASERGWSREALIRISAAVPTARPAAAFSGTLKVDAKTTGGLLEATTSTHTVEAAAFVSPPTSVTRSAWQ